MDGGLPALWVTSLDNLCENARLFLVRYLANKQGMQAIVDELHEIDVKADELVDGTNMNKAIGVGVGGLGAAVALSTFSSQTGAEKIVVIVATQIAAAAGAKIFLDSQAKKLEKEKELKERAEQLSREFINLVTPQKNALTEIKRAADALAENPTILRTTVGAPVKASLSEIEKLQQVGRVTADTDAITFIARVARQSKKTLDKLDVMEVQLKDFKEL